jgi:hypothetical protein
MLKTIRYAVVGIIALLCGGAFADGVPFITAGPAIAANDPILKSEVSKNPNFVKFHSVAFNTAAFGSNVLIVTIEGKDYRFVGSMGPTPPAGGPPTMAPTPSGPR